MTVHDRFASTDDGQRRLAGARLRYRILAALNTCLSDRGLNKTELADRLGVRKSAVGHVFNGDGNLRVNTIADYFAAMGQEIQLHVVPIGTSREQAKGGRPRLELLLGEAKPMTPMTNAGRVRPDAVRPWAADAAACNG